MIKLVVESCGRKRFKWRRVVKNENVGGTKMLKKLTERRKMFIRPCCKTDHHLISIPGVYEAPKTANLAVKMYKERSRKIFGPRFDCNSSSANKVFWQTIRRFRGKSLSTPTSERD